MLENKRGSVAFLVQQFVMATIVTVDSRVRVAITIMVGLGPDFIYHADLMVIERYIYI